MQIIERKLDCALLAPRIINDERGWYQVAFNIEEIQELGLEFKPVYQLNHSKTTVKGLVRGPNYQKRPFNQSKVVRVIKGAIYSVGIDIDPKSNTFGKAAGFYLSEENQYVLLDIMQFSDATPSLAQAIRMKKLEQGGRTFSRKVRGDYGTGKTKSKRAN